MPERAVPGASSGTGWDGSRSSWPYSASARSISALPTTWPRPTATTSAVKAEYHEVAAENLRLKKLAERARSEAVLRREARRQGMIVVGEQAYVVNGMKP